MTVAELIDALLKIPDDKRFYEVLSEGCDCVGDVASVDVEDRTNEVVLARTGRFEIG